MGEGRACTVIYRFGPFTLEPHSGELKKFGSTIRVPLQHARILALLLERAGEVVTREEFRQRIWAGNVFVDFDHGLRKAINRLREVLGDSIAEPKFIETLPRVGYRFISPVEVEQQAGESWDAAEHRERASVPPEARSADHPVRSDAEPSRWPMRRVAAIGSAAVVTALAFALILIAQTKPRPSLAYGANDWVLVAGFDNRTGDKSLDGVLQAALERELNNSHFVHVAPRERVHDILALMRRTGDGPLDAATAREVCVRDGGIKLLLAGTAEKLGSTYVLSVSVIDPRTGATLHSASSPAENEPQILLAVHRIGDELRGSLGEAVEQIRSSDRQFENVTTPSLEALRLYSIGYDLQTGGNYVAAVSFFEQAVKADPQFATAWLFLGWARFSARVEGERPAFERARALADQVSERERLFILQSWYMVDGERDKSLQYGELLVRLYPDHYWGANNTAALLWSAHRDAEAIALQRQCLQLRPDVQRALYLANSLRDIDPAASRELRQLAENLSSRSPKERFWLELNKAEEARRRGEFDSVANHVDAARPAGATDYYFKAAALAELGKLQAADAAASNSPAAANIPLFTAFLRKGFEGVRRFAEQHEAPTHLNSSDSLLLYATGAPEPQRRRTVQQARKLFTPPTYQMFEQAVDGELEIQRHEYRAGILHLEKVLQELDKQPIVFAPTAYGLIVDSLATAYEKTGDPKRAIMTMEKYRQFTEPDSAFPGAAPMRSIWERHLAELYRQSGDTAKAEAIEKTLASLLAHADPDYLLESRHNDRPATLVSRNR